VLDDRRTKLREELVASQGHWDDSLESLLAVDPDFFEAYLRLAAVPWRSGTLEPKVKELVLVALDSAATHLYEPGLRRHIRLALEHGATKEELLEVLQLTSTLGIHSCTVGVPLLLELSGAARGAESPRLSERQQRLKSDFEAKRGYWNDFWDGLLDLDPDFFEAYLGFSSVPWTRGVLEPKVKELIYTAFDVSATHLYVPGLRQHLQNAVSLGATPGEIMEVFELASGLGIKTCAVGVPILLEELERVGVDHAAHVSS
jgi:alkylhydroperoxidase/carboxymuconolactone decarboxylase family protein YurZ